MKQATIAIPAAVDTNVKKPGCHLERNVAQRNDERSPNNKPCSQEISPSGRNDNNIRGISQSYRKINY